ncbi:MAG TPA: amino acid adenylation domain-containing protein, partial [Chromatiales bacterium]|nr:amino acid adenylation domain-containing protein [Chromatiales bacterium]
MSQIAESVASLEHLLAAVHEAGIELWAEDGRLRYRAPAGALDPVLRQMLRARRTELLEWLESPRVAPLSWNQRSFWLLEQLNPGTIAAHEQFIVRLSGPLNRSALEQAWQQLIRRHDALRSRIEVHDDEPVQSADESCKVDWAVECNEPDEAVLHAIAQRELAQRFDLYRGPLLRARLLYGSQDRHCLLVTAHHIIADGLSVRVIVDELATLYAIATGVREDTLPVAPSHLAFARAQRQQITSRTIDAQLGFWREQLANLPACVDLPRRTAGSADRRERRLNFSIRPELADTLRGIARAADSSLFMLLLAAVRVLLVRLSGQADVPIGSPVTARRDESDAGLVGCLVNNLVFRTQVSGEHSFDALLRDERRTVLDAFEHCELPFESLVAALNPPRQPGVHPLFQVLFLYESPAGDAPVAGGLKFEADTLPVERESFWDLEWSFADHGPGNGIDGFFGYAVALYEPEFIECLPARLDALLTDIAADIRRPVGELDLWLPGERDRVLQDWNRTATDWSGPDTLYGLFRAQLARDGSRVAIIDRSHQLCYRELDARVERLAGELYRVGIRPGNRVGIHIARSADLVTAVLSVLRAGGICVPLDPAYPDERLHGFVEAAQPKLILTGDRAAPFEGWPVLALHTVDWQAGGQPCPWPARSADDPVWLLPTSGSTGRPRLAVGVNRTAVNRCEWMWRDYKLTSDDVYALRTSLNFVDAWWEIFGALGSGAQLFVIAPEQSTDALALLTSLADGQVTHAVMVPSLLRALLDETDTLGEHLPAMRLMITSGEPLPMSLLKRFRRSAPDIRLLNTYGTTEVWDVSCCELSGLDRDTVHAPIGVPIANVQAFVLDDSLQPVPPGVAAELFVGGFAADSGGYWRQPELTARRFIADPRRPGRRLYRTGDRARWLPDGTLECLGRRDDQVKLMGVRIELGEVEQVLCRHPEVAGAAARVDDDGHGPKLTAWVVPVSAAQPDPVELRRFALDYLPMPCVPSVIERVDALPLLPNGKLDRRALQRPVPGADASPAQLTSTGVRLARIWSALLDVPLPGPDADFFALGGHSLLATRLLAAVRTEFGVSLPMREFFLQPQLAAMAAAVDRARDDSPIDVYASPPAGMRLRGQAVTLSAAQQRLWFLEQLDPGSPAYHIAFTIELGNRVERSALSQALNDLLARHDSLRSVFESAGGRPRRRVLPDAEIRLASLDRPGEAQLTAFAREPFDLGSAPLLRAALCTGDDGRHRLLLVVHHLVTDGQSNSILCRELAAAYRARLRGQPPDWNKPAADYSGFIQWQATQLEDGYWQDQLDYWRRQLDGAPAAIELPTDRPRPAEQRFRGRWLRRQWSGQQLAALRAFGREHGCTLYMVLLAAFDALLARYSGQHDRVIGTPVAGRPAAAFDTVVGLFVNTLALRLRSTTRDSFESRLREVRCTSLEAQAHQDLPFEQLADALCPDRTLSRAPLFQVMFNLTTVPERRLDAGDSVWEIGSLLEHGVSNFDLSLNIGEYKDGAELVFEYDCELFDASSIEAFAQQYEQFLERALRDPGRSIAELHRPVGPPTGSDPTATAAAVAVGSDSVDLPVHRRVEACASRVPDAIALVDGKHRICYQALDRRANRLAWTLVEAGVSAGSRVALCGEDRAGLVVSMLGVLKAGAAYLVLDQQQPAARIRRMLDDAEPELLLCTGETPEWADGLRLLHIATQGESGDCESGNGIDDRGDHPPDVPHGELAYVLFTSGSSGRPKAVQVTHDNLASVADAWQRVYALEPADRHLQVANPAFDVFTGDWVRALTSGARLVFIDREQVLDPATLTATLTGQRISCVELVPALVRPLIRYLQRTEQRLPELRLLIVGSDTWYGHEYNALRSLAGPSTRVINSYGLTETTIDSCWFETGQPLAGAMPVPLGRPIANTRVYVCDESLQVLPVGVPGELCIGGAGVSAGYLNRPELTASRFVADPFEPGGRLYRTGDRARWTANGELQLLGRMDRQLKLRGFRIEPGEIEAVLGGCDGVTAAAVDLRETPDGDVRLAAWVVADDTVSDAQLRSEVLAQLPDYMCPAGWSRVDALPLTPNGKLDRSALPEPVWGAGTVGVAVAPRTAVESVLVELFESVLGVTGVGVHEDFFALGGHSLLAVQLVSRIRDAL